MAYLLADSALVLGVQIALVRVGFAVRAADGIPQVHTRQLIAFHQPLGRAAQTACSEANRNYSGSSVT